MKKEVFKLDNVSYSYNKVDALCDVGLTVFGGECLVVLGCNGSGKTTLLKLLDALIAPTRGTVSFLGTALKADGLVSGEFRKAVGLVFNEPEVQLFCPTVYEELSFGPLQLDMTEAEVNRRVEEVIEMMGLRAISERAPYTLSTGEKKKVAIASVLTVNPDVLLLDEPTSGLDPRTQVWLLGLIEALKGAGKTFVIATHDLSLAGDAADRVVVLGEHHRVAGSGDAAEVLGNKALLLKANLIHEHEHRHGERTHSHSHGPFSVHDEHE